jgi:PhnB protein
MTIHELFPYIRLRNAAEAIGFYARAFGAKESFRLVEPGTGRVGHAELDFGGTTLMLSDEYPELGILGPEAVGGTTLTLHLHVDDADAMIEAAVAAGATLVRAPADHFYGERSGTVRDPFGHEWNIGHELEKLTPAQMQARYEALFGAGT